MNLTTGGRPTRAGPPKWVNRLVLTVLRSPAHGLLDARVCELRYRTPRTDPCYAQAVLAYRLRHHVKPRMDDKIVVLD
jgi:hypothetical protein